MSQLIYNISKFLNCGVVSEKQKYIQFRVAKFEDIKSKIVPFFEAYSMHGIKNLNYKDFCGILELVQSKEHFTAEGISRIKKIKECMNLNRS